jgi:hypothetical protein
VVGSAKYNTDPIAVPSQELARRRKKVPESEFTDGPEGLKIYDIVVGAGTEAKVSDAWF